MRTPWVNPAGPKMIPNLGPDFFSALEKTETRNFLCTESMKDFCWKRWFHLTEVDM